MPDEKAVDCKVILRIDLRENFSPIDPRLKPLDQGIDRFEIFRHRTPGSPYRFFWYGIPSARGAREWPMKPARTTIVRT